jgi:hypothetical protein
LKTTRSAVSENDIPGGGGGPGARSTTLCTAPVGSNCLPGLLVVSRVSPSAPSAMNRACHLHTTGFELPERRMISLFV